MIVYCIENKINGKKYIGWTSGTIEFRWKNHVYASRFGKCLLQKAIRKYGSSDDIWSRIILEECESELEAKAAEIRLIAELKTNAMQGGFGYNMTSGGDGNFGYRFSDESKRKMSLSRKGRKRSERYDARGENNPFFGLTHSEEFRKRLSEIASQRRGRKNPNSKLTVAQCEEIKSLIQQGLSNAAIARHYNVSVNPVAMIRLGRHWSCA